MAREFSRVGVVGLGTMGAGIAEVFARNGLTRGRRSTATRPRSTAAAGTSSTRPAGRSPRGKLTEAEQAALLDRISFATELTALADADLVVEAVPEQLELKRAIFAQLDEICRPDTILATNTSSLSVTEIAVATGRPGKVVGMHFFNPAPVMKLVEVVRTVVTEPEVVADVEALAAALGKTDVTIGDRAGFIANALLFGYLNHAVAMYEQRYATPRGHRRGDAARLRPADGPAGAARPDRPRHRLRDPRHDVPAVARPAARPDPDPQADDHRRAARPQDRPRLLHLRRPGLADGGRRRRRRRRPSRPAAERARRSARSASSAPARWPPASSRSSPRPATRSRFVARADGQGRRGRARRSTARWRRRSQRGKLTEDDRDAALARITGSTVAGRPRRRATWSSRRSSRTWRSSRRCSPTSTRSASPARCWPPPPRRCR